MEFIRAPPTATERESAVSKASPFKYSPPEADFKIWQEFVRDRIGLEVEQRQIDDRPFDAAIAFNQTGDLRFARINESGLITEVTKRTLACRPPKDTFYIRLQIQGMTKNIIGNEEIIQNPGDILVLGFRPNVHVSSLKSEVLLVELPTEQLKLMLGKAYNNEFIKINNNDPKTALVSSFLQNLERVSKDLDQQSAQFLSRIGASLIVDCISSRLSEDKSAFQSGELIFLRAKAYIEENLGNHSLDPTHLASALGLSLRQLQVVFQERNQSISEWIWGRRVDAVAKLLDDSRTAHVAIGALANSCGFASQAHFSRRFKEHFKMSPRDYKYRTR
ncbi:Transcriptional activator NphR (plasmid) [Methylobacterium bullatum]|uniref:Transcriptional activator NphR n=1 Tax=Methylobacterium bullatum TaxID=570505 RepID=A0A679K0D6_9HYPH|nr:Transcriptional activator NphR [Methylobacterium bullatum]